MEREIIVLDKDLKDFAETINKIEAYCWNESWSVEAFEILKSQYKKFFGETNNYLDE